MPTAPSPQKPRFSPLAILIGVLALGGLFAAAGYAIALATRPAPTVAPVASVPVVEKVVPIAEKVEPKPVAKKADVPVVAKRVWTKEEAIAEAKRMAEALVDEDFEKAKVNLIQADYIDFLMVKDSIDKTDSKLPFSACNPRAYGIAKDIGMSNYFTKRIVLWAVNEKHFPETLGLVWKKVESFRNPDAVFNAAVVYGMGHPSMLHAIAWSPSETMPMPLDGSVKAFWEAFGSCRWSELVK